MVIPEDTLLTKRRYKRKHISDAEHRRKGSTGKDRPPEKRRGRVNERAALRKEWRER